MGFNYVFRVLQEVFPQEDSRFLESVSLRHPMDADAAVEEVLAHGSSSNSYRSHSDVGGKKVHVNPCVAECSTKEHVSSIDGSFVGATEDPDFSTQFTSHTFGQYASFKPSVMSFNRHASNETEANYDTNGVPLPLETFGGSNNINANSKSSGSGYIDDEKLTAPEHKQLVDTSENNLAATQESDPNCSTKTVEKDDLAGKFVNSEGESAMSSVFTRSEQICSTEYLDEVIEDAKSKKKMLELAMDSVVEFMKAVESAEKDAEQANEYATRGCSDILAKVDEVKNALLRAKEANEMHAGEVNAEKAILATEFRELQHRLFTLSDDRNKSLAILDEMRRALEIRMAAALEEIAAAEAKKLEREQSAREALLYQESQMEKVVEESKKLKLEAEENSKLQDFLMDRGRAIDILQGEMAVKCQDVLLLKEKFDKRIPLSQSLASHNSSFRSTTTPFEHESEIHGSPKKSSEQCDKISRLDGSPKSSDMETVDCSNGEEKKGDDGLLDDDGWELFNNGDFLVR